MFLKSLLLLFSVSSLSFANYAWIPKYQNLRLRFSGDYYKSQENFTESGDRENFSYNGNTVQFSEYEYALQMEYGFAKDWSAGIKSPFKSSTILGADGSYDTTYLSASGLGDTLISLKWFVKPGDTRLAIESLNTIPLYATSVLSADEMVLGDGVFSSGLKLHGGHTINGIVSFALSPGLLLKFQGYSSQVTLDAAIGVTYKPVYFRLVSDLGIALEPEMLSASVVSNPAVGSGGTFAKLSNSPNLWTMGIVGGVFFYEQYRMELYASQSILGSRAANGYKFGVAFATSFDFYKEEKKIQVKEVPFDAEPQTDRP